RLRIESELRGDPFSGHARHPRRHPHGLLCDRWLWRDRAGVPMRGRGALAAACLLLAGCALPRHPAPCSPWGIGGGGPNTWPAPVWSPCTPPPPPPPPPPPDHAHELPTD